MSSSKSAWLPSPLKCSPQKQNGWTLRLCFWGWGCIIKQLLNSVFAWYHELSKPRVCIICLSLRLRQITQTSVLVIHDIMLNVIQYLFIIVNTTLPFHCSYSLEVVLRVKHTDQSYLTRVRNSLCAFSKNEMQCKNFQLCWFGLNFTWPFTSNISLSGEYFTNKV